MDRSGGPDACWPWLRTKPAENGYCRDYLRRGRQEYVHRLSWELTHGPIPPNRFVCHTCDNPLCCNPTHLFLGTNEENIADKVRKGRQPRGETNGRAKLTDADILTIRARYACGGVTQEEIANVFGVDQSVVSRIVRRLRWRHVV